jgi:hypothetical protein
MRNSKKRMAPFLAVVISIAIHVLFFSFYIMKEAKASHKKENSKLIELVKFKEKEENKIYGTTVELDDKGNLKLKNNDQDKKKIRFRSDKKSRVEKETYRKFNRQKSSKGKTRKKQIKDVQLKRPDKAQKISKSDLLISMADIDTAVKNEKGSHKYLRNVKKGGFTLLNTDRYTYAAFFNKVNKIIRLYWQPDFLRIVNPNEKDIVCILLFKSSADGKLISVDIVEPSGYQVFDYHNIQVMKKTFPIYEKIPKALLNEEGIWEDRATFTIFYE